MISNVNAALLLHTRIAYSEHSFAELALWRLPRRLPGSAHPYKYRLAYVVRAVCVIRYDNEAGKGDHVHLEGQESSYAFVSPERLISDFQDQIERWNRENPDT